MLQQVGGRATRDPNDAPAVAEAARAHGSGPADAWHALRPTPRRRFQAAWRFWL